MEDVVQMLHRLYRAILFTFLMSIAFAVSVRAQHDEKRSETSIQDSSKDDPDIALPTGEFTVQVGAFTKEGNARRLAKKFRADGWSVDLFDNVLEGKNLVHLVWIGSYSSLEEAHQQQALIEKRYKIRGVIRQRTGWKKR